MSYLKNYEGTKNGNDLYCTPDITDIHGIRQLMAEPPLQMQ